MQYQIVLNVVTPDYNWRELYGKCAPITLSAADSQKKSMQRVAELAKGIWMRIFVATFHHRSISGTAQNVYDFDEAPPCTLGDCYGVTALENLTEY